jgi:hypothetical protein
MGTLRGYYETDFARYTNVSQGVTLQTPDGPIGLSPRVHWDDDSNAMFVSCFIPVMKHASLACVALVEHLGTILKAKDGLQILTGYAGQDPDEQLDTKTLQFSGRLFVYLEEQLSKPERVRLASFASQRRVVLSFRGAEYAAARSGTERPLAFISHDSRDKDIVARPLATGLIKRACPVWYDEYSLRPGERLRESIERGLKECKKCILVISPSFLSNSGWSRVEFDSIFTRELVEKCDLLLPVWHDVTVKDVFQYSPTLADRFALKWEVGVDEVVRRLHTEIVRAS